jgi:hypothetical protein
MLLRKSEYATRLSRVKQINKLKAFSWFFMVFCRFLIANYSP